MKSNNATAHGFIQATFQNIKTGLILITEPIAHQNTSFINHKLIHPRQFHRISNIITQCSITPTAVITATAPTVEPGATRKQKPKKRMRKLTPNPNDSERGSEKARQRARREPGPMTATEVARGRLRDDSWTREVERGRLWCRGLVIFEVKNEGGFWEIWEEERRVDWKLTKNQLN